MRRAVRRNDSCLCAANELNTGMTKIGLRIAGRESVLVEIDILFFDEVIDQKSLEVVLR